MKFTTTIVAANIFKPSITEERTYTFEALNKHEAEIKGLEEFWVGVNPLIMCFVDQYTTEVG